jgi:hypothetical protein
MFLNIIHRPVSVEWQHPLYISKNNVSETVFYLHLQVEPTQLGPIVRATSYLRTDPNPVSETSCFEI